MEFRCILKLAFMVALVRLSSQKGLYFKNHFPCTLIRISLSPQNYNSKLSRSTKAYE